MKPEALIGRTLADKYTLDSLLGVGGFGAVYRARQAPIDRAVAVKVNLHSHRSDLQARFLREARLQAELRHPGCVMLLDCGETEGLFYLVQEFVEGRSLQAELAAGPLAPARAVALTGQVLDALGEAHRQSIVHRDIKPANVMLTAGRDGREEVRVLDFGIAKLLVDDTDEPSLTGTGVSLGTPAYMAPEQIRPGPIGPPTDLYAVGAMLFRLLTGRPVFSGPTIDVLTQQLNAPPPPLPTGLSPLDPIIARAMAKPPAERFRTAAEMWSALRAIDVEGLRGVGPGGARGPGDTAMTTTRAGQLGWAETLASGPTAITPAADTVEPVAPPSEGRGVEAQSSEPPSRARWIAPALLIALAGFALAVWLLDGEVGRADGRRADAGRRAVTPGDMALAAPADGALADAALGGTPLDAAPDAAPPDAAPPDGQAVEGRTPDASPPPRRARRVAPPRDASRRRLEATFARHLERCACAEAKSTLQRLTGLPGVDAGPSTRRYVRACELLLPDNCTAR